MRQGDGSDLLGQGDPRNADIGILYVGPDDSRQEILTAINAQELQGRKQIAIVLLEQGKAFRQPVEFDGLKNMRRGLKAQLIFIARPGPGPADFAHQRRFVVYSSLETFRTALLSERASFNPRTKTPASDEKRPGILGRNRASKEREQNPPPAPQRVVDNVPMVMPLTPIPPTPRIMPAASVQPVMPPTPPTPRISPQSSGPDSQAVPPMPIEEMDTHTLEFENPAPDRGSGAALASGVVLGALAANALDDDDDLAPPVTPRHPQDDKIVPSGQGSATPGGQAGGARTANTQRSPTPLMLGQQTNTPRPGGSGKLPAASAQGSQTRTGSGKQPVAQGRGGSRPGPTQGQGRGTKQLSADQGTPDASGQPNGKSSSSGKIPVVVPVGAIPLGSPAVGGGAVPASSRVASAATVAAAAGTPGAPGSRQVGLTPLPPPVSQRRRRSRRGRRLFLIAALLILLTLLVGWLVVNASGGLGGLASLGHLTATVTITPRNQTVQNNYLIEAVTTPPDAGQREVAARVLTQSNTQQATGNATGSIPAKQAVGPLLFFNGTGAGLTIAGSKTVLTAANGTQVTFSGNVFVPATGNGEATVNNAYAIQAGAAGNIPALSIAEPCCVAGITVKNPSAFSGGQDAQPDSVIQQSDINGAANPLIARLTTSTKAALRQQVKGNERVVDGPQPCPSTVTEDHKVGDIAKSVMVSVAVKCTEEVFDFASAQQIASSLLQANPPNNVDLTGYTLVGPIITSQVSANVVSGENQVSVNMQAAGKWVYQFSSQMQQNIKQALVKQSKADAQTILKQYAGLATASISISSGSTMPTNASDITVNIVSVPGLSPGAPTSTSSTPVGASNTPAGEGTPGATPTGSPEQGS